MRKFIVISILFLFISCSTNDHAWLYERNSSGKNFNYDYGICDMEAKQTAAEAVGSSEHPNNLSIFKSIIWSKMYREAFDRCMNEKGYKKITKR
jgi:hypothetical protein